MYTVHKLLNMFVILCSVIDITIWLYEWWVAPNAKLQARYYRFASIQKDIISVYITFIIHCQIFPVNSFGATWRGLYFRWLHYQYWLFRVLIYTVWSEYINTQPKKLWMWNITLYWCGEFYFTYEFWEFWEFWDLKIGIL